MRYEVQAEPVAAGHCHCLDCRKSSGTGHCSHLVVPAAVFRVSGELRFYDAPADSGNMISRGFCPTCGCAVYSKNSGMSAMVFPRASSLDDPEEFKPQMVVYASRAPSWDRIGASLPTFDAMPPHEAMPGTDS